MTDSNEKSAARLPLLLPRPVHGFPPPDSPRSEREKNRKRQQVQVACEACQKRKTKCTGERPTCTACEKKNTECVYETEENEPRGAGLKRKQMAMTKENDDLKFFYNTLRNSTDSEAQEILRRMRGSDDVSDVVSLIRDSSVLLPKIPYSSDSSPLTQYSRGATDLQSPSEEGGPAKRRRQSRSIYSSSQEADRSRYTRSGEADRSITSGANSNISNSSSSANTPSGHLHTPIYNVPAKPWTTVSDNPALISHLISLYFAWSHPFYNFIEKDLFLSDMIHSQKTYCSALLVNAVLTQACHLSDRLDTPARQVSQPDYIGNRFAQEATRLLPEELEHPSLTTIQALLVLTVAACSDGRNDQGWAYMESTVSTVAQMDLLHYGSRRPITTNRGGEGGISAAAADMERARAMTAWGMFTLTSNIVFSIRRAPLLSRPPNLDIPSPHERIADGKKEGGRAAQVEPPVASTFEANCHLAVIVNEVSQVLFNDSQRGDFLSVREAESFYRRLIDWRQTLPETLSNPAIMKYHYVATLFGFYHIILQTVLRAIEPSQMGVGDGVASDEQESTTTPAHQDISEPFLSARRAILASSSFELNSLIVALQPKSSVPECVLYTADLIMQAAYTVIDELHESQRAGLAEPEADHVNNQKLLLYAQLLLRSGGRWFLYIAELRTMQTQMERYSINVPAPLQVVFDEAFGEDDELWNEAIVNREERHSSPSQDEDSDSQRRPEEHSYSTLSGEVEKLRLQESE